VSEAELRARTADLDRSNAREVLAGHSLVFDGSDNFETRLLVCDAARSLSLPSVYAASVGQEGLVSVTIPGATPCLRCYLEALPPPGSGPTCDTAGIVPTLPPLVAAIGMTEALAVAVGQPPGRGVLSVTVWSGGFRSRRLFESASPSRRCPGCGEGRFPALEGEGETDTVKLCGRHSVQVARAARQRPDLEALERRLSRVGRVRRSAHLLSAEVEDVNLTVFFDGRCIVRGTADPARARSMYQKYVAG
jgi:adenylyltransferase/sulfurtransferase